MYTKHKWESDIFYNFGYVKYLPNGYDENKKYPLVFFLHGAGERGDDLDVASRHGFMRYVREQVKNIRLFLLRHNAHMKSIGDAIQSPYLPF